MTSPVRIPADVELPDRVLGPLTARQLAIIAVTALVLYAGWDLTRTFLPLPAFLAVAVPVGAAVTVLAIGQRDGMSLDRLLWAAIRHRAAPRHQVAAPEQPHPTPGWLTAHATTPDGRPATGGHPTTGGRGRRGGGWPAALRLPARSITTGGNTAGTTVGVIDLGVDGLAVVAAASTVNFALRTPGEQESLAACFGRYLHSLATPVQILVRAEHLDLTGQVRDLHARAAGLPHPALQAAALEHADYLTRLGAQSDLLRRQVLLVLREPGPAAPSSRRGARPPVGERRDRAHRRADSAEHARRATETRLVRRLTEAVELLAPAGIVITPLDAGRATAVLASACNPGSALPPSAGLAGADQVITSRPTRGHPDQGGDGWNGSSWNDRERDDREWHHRRGAR